MRTIKDIRKAAKVDMGGILLDQALPINGIDQIDPFLLVHHWASEYKGGQKQKNVGVGPHPHRGFSPVTFIFKGGVHHRDSKGHESVVNEGGTQWMNSGKGLIHSERPRKDIAENGGEFEIIQFWVNAPSNKKMEEPSYQPLSAQETPTLLSEDKKVKIGLVAGELMGKKGKINPHSELLALRLEIEKGGEIKIPVPKEYNVFVYQLNGNSLINEKNINDKELVLFENDNEDIIIKGNENSRAILLAGKPINEPVATYGPFVMNSQSEIVSALNDFQSGKMGTLVEKFD